MFVQNLQVQSPVVQQPQQTSCLCSELIRDSVLSVIKHLLQASSCGTKTQTLHFLKLSVSYLVIQKVRDLPCADFCIYKQIHMNFTTYEGVERVFCNFIFCKFQLLAVGEIPHHKTHFKVT